MIILQGGLIRAYNLTTSLTFSHVLIMFITITTFVTTGGTLTPRRVFTTLSLVGVMKDLLLFLFERGVFQFSESRVGGSRIQVRLLSHGLLGEVSSLKECVRPLCRAVKCVCTPSLDCGCFTKAKLLNHVKGSRVVNTLSVRVSVPPALRSG